MVLAWALTWGTWLLTDAVCELWQTWPPRLTTWPSRPQKAVCTVETSSPTSSVEPERRRGEA